MRARASQALHDALSSALDCLPTGVKRLILAYSAGIDSVALLELLQDHRDRYSLSLWHIHHGLQPNADEMMASAKDNAERLGLDCRIDHLQLDAEQGNLEAVAREARYRLFAEALEADTALLTAHHLDDQAETLLLNLMRAAGPAGLAGIARLRPLGRGWLLRPLLDVSRRQIHDFVTQRGLGWVEDPSNAGLHPDRNFLRHQVLPLLKQRWPAAARQLAVAAAWQGESAQLLQALAEIDARDCLVERPFAAHPCLHIPSWQSLDPARRKNLLRYWLLRETGRVPDQRSLAQILQQSGAREDAQPSIEADGFELRRYRDDWYLVGGEEVNPAESRLLKPGQSLRYRPQLQGEAAQTHRLKRLFQQEGVPPWLRDRVPLLFEGDRLVGLWKG